MHIVIGMAGNRYATVLRCVLVLTVSAFGIDSVPTILFDHRNNLPDLHHRSSCRLPMHVLGHRRLRKINKFGGSLSCFPANNRLVVRIFCDNWRSNLLGQPSPFRMSRGVVRSDSSHRSRMQILHRLITFGYRRRRGCAQTQSRFAIDDRPMIQHTSDPSG